MTRRLTQILVVTTLAVLIGYNIVIHFEPTPNDSISAVMWTWVTNHPVVPAAMGVLMGHWVWPPRDRIPAYGPAALAVWGVIVAAADWFGWLPQIPALLSLAIGLLLGAWLWGPTHRDVEGR